jgi:cytochrome c553
VSAPGGRSRRRTNEAVAQVGIILAMLFLMFASAIAGFAVGRGTDDGANTPVASTTQTTEETVTTSGGGGGETTTSETTTAAQTTTSGGGGGSSTAEGKQIFASAGCGSCHVLKAAGSSGTVGPNLDESKPSLDLTVERVTNGKPPMPAFKGQLSDAQIQAVAQFVSSSTRGS